ncbi:LacI family DNA-binding transcriptional regulator, partial [Undibacterium sp. CCC2.1]
MATDALTSGLISSESQAGNGHASLADVARLAGVSAQTVSRVVNRKNNVAEPTLTRVREALDALSFQPNRIARSLVLN